MATSTLDLLGVLLLGLVALLAASTLQGSGVPSQLETVLARIGLADARPEYLTGVLALAAGLLLIVKSAIYGYLMKVIFRFLGTAQAQVSARLSFGLFHDSLTGVESRSSQSTAYALTSGASAAILGVLGSWSVVLAEISLLIVLGLALILINPLVTIAAVVFLSIVGLGVQKGLSSWSRGLGEQIGEAAVSSYQYVQESVAAYREIVITDRRQLVTRRVSRLLNNYSVSLSDSYFAAQIPKLVYESALVVGGIALAGWQFAVSDSLAAIATLALFLAGGARIIPSMLRVSVQSAALVNAAGQARPTYELAQSIELRLPHRSVVEEQNDEQLSEHLYRSIKSGYPGIEPRVRMRDVTFFYPGSKRPAIEGITLEILPGRSLALVGSTGSGKSTLADLLLGLQLPSSGSVEIGGVLPELALGKWPGAIGYVPQQVSLMDTTVRENVALGFSNEFIDDEQVWSALESAQIADFVARMPDDIFTVVGERGFRLSGGQRQRIGLARALYSAPVILVLDEATSALDAETEEAITSALRRLAGRVTTVTIAHRLATVVDSDQVAFLSEGRLVALGTFSEVREAVPQFDRQAHLLGL